MPKTTRRVRIGLVASSIVLAGLCGGRLWSQGSSECLPDPAAFIPVGETAMVDVGVESWLGVPLSWLSVYRVDVQAAEGTALEAWLGDYDSGAGQCYLTSSPGPVADAEVVDGSAVLTWSGGGAGLDLLKVTSPFGVTSQTIEVTATRIAEPPDRRTQVIPVVAHAPGKFESAFRSDVTLYNPQSSPEYVSFLLRRPEGDVPVEGETVIEPGETLRLDDIVQGVFGTAGTGSLWIETAGSFPVVNSRTYTESAGGTSGQFIGAQRWFDAATFAPFGGFGADDGRRLLLHLGQGADSRTNVGFAEVMGLDASVALRLFDASGQVVAEGTVEVPAWSHIQINDIFAFLETPALDVAALETRVTGFARVFSYASVVDNTSNDPILVPAIALKFAHPTMIIPAAASGDGVRGTRWRTDVRIVAADALSNLRLTFVPFDGSEPVVYEADVDIAAGGQLALDDVIAGIGGDGSGTLILEGSSAAGQAAMVATSRTYNLTDHGTFGQFVPAVQPLAGVARSVLAGIDGSPDYRTNVGLVNPRDDRPVRVTIRLLADRGVVLGAREIELGPGRSRQLNDIFQWVGVTPVRTATVEIIAESDEVGVIAYASVVDNRSGDAIYIPATPVSYYPLPAAR